MTTTKEEHAMVYEIDAGDLIDFARRWTENPLGYSEANREKELETKTLSSGLSPSSHAARTPPVQPFFGVVKK
jgi:hypothetical protein